METTLGRRAAAAVRSSSNFSGGGNNNINVSSSSGSHNPSAGAPGGVLIGGSTTATSGVGSGSLSSSSTATGPRLRRQRSYEWRERQYSTSEDENVVTTSGGAGLLHVGNTRTSNASLQSAGSKQRASPTPAVYAAGIASLLAGYSSKYPVGSLPDLCFLNQNPRNWKCGQLHVKVQARKTRSETSLQHLTAQIFLRGKWGIY
jgi:hypothetical protein